MPFVCFNLLLIACTSGGLFQDLANANVLQFPLMFSSSNSMASDLRCKLLLHLDFHVRCKIRILFYSFACTDPNSPGSFAEGTVLSSGIGFSSIFQDFSRWVFFSFFVCMESFLGFLFCPIGLHICFVPVTDSFNLTGNCSVQCLGIWYYDTSSFYFVV